MGAGHTNDRRTTSPYEAAMMAFLWAWISLNGVLALWLHAGVDAWLALAGPPIGFALICGWTYFGRFLLMDIQPWFGLKEKFCFFLFSAIVFLAPSFINMRFDSALSLLALNIPLLLMACRPGHFHRIYCANLAILFLVVRRVPDFPSPVLLVEAILICGCFACDYVAFRARERPEIEGVEPGLLLRAVSIYWIAAAGALGACWAMMPALRPQWFRFEGWFKWSLPPRRAGLAEPVSVESLALDAAILIVSGVIMLAMARWIIRRLAKKKKPQALEFEDEKFMLRKAPAPLTKRRALFDTSTPRGRIVQAYNHFLLTLAEKGMGKPSAATPAEYARDLEDTTTLSRKSLIEITTVFERAHYGEAEFSQEEAQAYCERAQSMANGAARLTGQDFG